MKKDHKYCLSCGAPCAYADDVAQYSECEGQVEAVEEVDYGDDDHGWIHACTKHEKLYH